MQADENLDRDEYVLWATKTRQDLVDDSEISIDEYSIVSKQSKQLQVQVASAPPPPATVMMSLALFQASTCTLKV
jgi:hypothetical protein